MPCRNNGSPDIKLWLYHISLLLVACTGYLASCGSPNQFGDSYVIDSHYVTYSDAMADQATAKGWLPLWLPKSATDVFERHSCDTNEVWARFSVSSDDLRAILGNSSSVDGADVVLPRSPNVYRSVARITWWPANLKRIGSVNDIYHYNGDGRSYVRVDMVHNLIYYWAEAQ